MSATLVAEVGRLPGGRVRILGIALVVLMAVLALQVSRLAGGIDASPPRVAEVASSALAVVDVPGQPAGGPVVAAAQPVWASLESRPPDASTPSVSHDPFVPQIVAERTGSDTAPSVEATATLPGTAVPAAAPRFATISVNGVEERLALDGHFPGGEEVFVLEGLDGRTATIQIADGAAAQGPVVTLELGRIVTLQDAGTGARYRLELLYLGAEPEQTLRFVAGKSPRAVAPAH